MTYRFTTLREFKKAFWNKTVQNENCLLWTGTKWGRYGRCAVPSLLKAEIPQKMVYAHRMAFYLTHGYWTSNEVMHICDTPMCVKPLHLADGTHAENIADAVRKGRMTGPINPTGPYTRWKLTPEIQTRVRYLYKLRLSQLAIANATGISVASVNAIINNKL